MNSDDLLTAPQVAKICSTDLKTIHNWVNRGKIEGFRTPGRHLRFKHKDVLKFLEDFNYPVPAGFIVQKGKIIIIDPEKQQSNPIEKAIGINAEVLSFDDIMDAMINIGMENPSLVLVNSMADRDVLRVVRKIAQNKKDTPIVLYGTGDYSQRGFLEAGATKCVKTTDPESIAEVAIETLNSNKQSA